MANRLIRILFLPAAVFLWIIGWIMMCAGSRKEQETRPKTAIKRESITIMPMIPEEQEQLEARTPA